MPVVDENRMRGNHAQAIAASWLSRRCLVRPVAEGTDIGIDLYCEAITAAGPSHHFWAQVKSIPLSAVSDGVAAHRFERRHLAYWKRQPIPVYAFLVPLGKWPPDEPIKVFGVRITEHLVRHGLPSADSITLRTSDSFSRSSIDEDLETFVSRIVPWDSAALLLQRGIIARLPGPENRSLEDRFVRDIGVQHLPEVLLTIRDAAGMGLLACLLAEIRDPSWKTLRRRFQAVAESLEEEMQPIGLSALVRAAHVDGDIREARGYVQRELERIAKGTDLSDEERQHCTKQMHVLLDELPVDSQ